MFINTLHSNSLKGYFLKMEAQVTGHQSLPYEISPFIVISPVHLRPNMAKLCHLLTGARMTLKK